MMLHLIRKTVLIVALLVPLTSAGADDRPQPTTATEDPQEFQFDGLWQPKGAMLRGVLLPTETLGLISLRIEGDNYEVSVQGEAKTDKGTVVLDKTVTPARMTIKSVSGPNAGKTILAIYEIRGENAMRVCYDLSGKAFPTEFKAPKGSDCYLVGYRRQIPPPADSPDK